MFFDEPAIDAIARGAMLTRISHQSRLLARYDVAGGR
jgi:hypothetical protein